MYRRHEYHIQTDNLNKNENWRLGEDNIKNKEDYYNKVIDLIEYFSADAYEQASPTYFLQKLDDLDRRGKPYKPLILKMRKKTELTSAGWTAFLYILYKTFFAKEFSIDARNLVSILKRCGFIHIDAAKALTEVHVLEKHEILEVKNERYGGKESFAIHPHFEAALNKELGTEVPFSEDGELEQSADRGLSFFSASEDKDYSAKSYNSTLQNIRKRYEMIERASRKKLYYPPALNNELQLVRNSAGHMVSNIMKDTSRDRSLRILLYGPSGTGKTAFVYELARQIKAPIMKVDSSHIFTMWFGMSEQNMKQLFKDYEDLVRSTVHYKKVFPILFFDEIDQLMTSRSASMSNTNHTYLRVQEIFLSRIEEMHGIFVGTTNFEQNIDSAWFRRFNLKIHVPLPDYATRVKIWRSYLKDAALYSEKVNDLIKKELASFPISGGLIKNFVSNMFVYDIVTPDGLLSNEQFIIDKIRKEVKEFKVEQKGTVVGGFGG